MLEKGIHFVFQHVPRIDRQEWFLRCWDSWLPTFLPQDSIVVMQSGGKTALPEPCCDFKMVYSDMRLLAAAKRNMGIALAEKEYTMLIDDDILLMNKDWRTVLEDRLASAPNEYSVVSLAPRIRIHSIIEITDQWYRMQRIGLNCVIAKTVLWKALPHLNYTESADKTIVDVFARLGITMWQPITPSIKHLSVGRSMCLSEKIRDIKKYKQLWFSNFIQQLQDKKQILNTLLKN